ncbi:MAG: D-glycero-beta-D-manno-heptose 1-phosphate adenylyltransferase [Gemmatimonadetes bacterium]|nr:D-glycero-beta-D-manno-heptose 1-phosphate adenylyltransferase [Gemmatimonadota bacterium]
MSHNSPKILARSALITQREQLCRERRTVVLTNGCFDLLHRGHVEYLRQARALGDCLAVGLNDDESVHALKGPGRPIVPQEDRAALLAALQCVSHVCIFPEESVESLVNDLLPDVLVKGGDYAQKDIVGREIVEAHGGRVCALPLWQGLSSSDLINRIRGLSDG